MPVLAWIVLSGPAMSALALLGGLTVVLGSGLAVLLAVAMVLPA